MGTMDALRQSTVTSAGIEKMMVRLAERLQNTGGKKVYGYLKRDVKFSSPHFTNMTECPFSFSISLH